MHLKVLCLSSFKKGTALTNLINMTHYNHPEVEFISYEHGQKGHVWLGNNTTLFEGESKIRKVVFVCSVPTIRKRNRMDGWENMDHVVYLSDFCKNIIESDHKSNSNSKLLFFGGLPVDNDLNPIDKPRHIDGPIQFIAIAKWYKRRYKRLKQIIKLYNSYLKKEYPGSILNIIGAEDYRKDGNIHYYKKSFHNKKLIDIFKKSHIQLTPTPFDTGPKTIAESLHYRVPFICSNNCAGIEYIKVLGKCGIEVDTDPYISSLSDYNKYQPLSMVSKNKFHARPIPYEDYFEAVKQIINNFEEYTSWQWNDKFNYTKQSDSLYNILKGK
jgi:hypothetical protein